MQLCGIIADVYRKMVQVKSRFVSLLTANLITSAQESVCISQSLWPVRLSTVLVQMSSTNE